MQYIFVYIALLFFYLLDKIRKYGVEKQKKEYVSNIIHGDWQIDHYYINYNFDFFEMIQRELDLTNKYRLNNDDKEQVEKIFEEFKKDLSEKYFSNRISLPKTKFAINNDTFLMYSLYLFLDNKTCATFFCEEPMQKKIITQKYYGEGPFYYSYDATYSITEFATVVFKLLYISYMYCKNSTSLNPKGNYFKNEKWIEDVIDTQKISIMVYPPSVL